MCIVGRPGDLGGRERRQLAGQGGQVGEDGHGLEAGFVGVGPAGQLVQVAADPGQLAGARLLDIDAAGGPGPDAAEGTADELREGQAGCRWRWLASRRARRVCSGSRARRFCGRGLGGGMGDSKRRDSTRPEWGLRGETPHQA